MQPVKLSFGKQQYTVSVGPGTLEGEEGWDVKRHCNAQYELHIALKGTCVMDVESESITISVGDAVLIAPGAYHSPVKTTEDYVFFVVSFVLKPGSADKELKEKISFCQRLSLSEFELSVCNEINKEVKEGGLFHEERRTALYSILISNLFRKLHFPGQIKEDDSTAVDKRLETIDDFFEQNLAEDATEEALAKRLNLSRRQINRVLKTCYGMSFREKLRCARLNSAGWLLVSTDMSVAEISRSVGYESYTSFFKAFREYYEMTPKHYRDKMRK